MNPSRSDRSQIRQCIRQAQQDINTAMHDIVKMKCAQSAYPVMSRQDRRIAENHADRVSQENSLQRDMDKADRMVDRIGQVLEQFRSDFNQIKNHIGNYDFPAEEPNGATGDCLNDFSAAIDTRQAWKDTLCCMLKNVRNYANQQYLGDYKLLHNYTGTSGASCCPVGHRAEFKYKTPSGDCLRLAGAAESSKYVTTVQNPDMDINGLYAQLCLDPVVSVYAEEDWFDKIYKIVIAHKPAESPSVWTAATVSAAKAAALLALDVIDLLISGSNTALAQLLVNGVMSGTARDVTSLSFVEAVFFDVLRADFAFNNTVVSTLTGNQTCFTDTELETLLGMTAGDFAPFNGSPAFYPTVNPPGTTLINTIHGWRNPSGLTPMSTVLELVGGSLVASIADESDTAFTSLVSVINSKMHAVRKAQLVNDGEKKTIAYVRETSECNRAYHEQRYGEHTSIDESELDQRQKVAQNILSDLDNLYRENCVSKQSFFRNNTFKGGC